MDALLNIGTGPKDQSTYHLLTLDDAFLITGLILLVFAAMTAMVSAGEVWGDRSKRAAWMLFALSLAFLLAVPWLAFAMQP